MGGKYFEKPDAIFNHAPVVKDLCIEFGIPKTDVETINYMNEVFKRVSGSQLYTAEQENERNYDEGYQKGYVDGIDAALSKIGDLSWEVENLKR